MNAVLASRQDTSLHNEPRHEARLLKLEMDNRCALLDLKIKDLQRQLEHETTTQRQCLLSLVGAMVIFAFCMLVALAPG